MRFVIVFLIGFVLGIIFAWIREDYRIKRLTVENRQLQSDKEIMKKIDK